MLGRPDEWAVARGANTTDNEGTGALTLGSLESHAEGF